MNKNKDYFNERASHWDERKNIKSDEFYKDFVFNKLKLRKGDKALDLACGTGILTNLIYQATQNEVVGLDISDKMIEIANKKNSNSHIRFEAKDFYEYEGETFDVIICHNAFPHFLDKEGFKNKCYEILNPDGILIICHSFSKDEVNNLHKRPGIIESNPALDPKDEAEIFKDKFELIDYKDEDIYVIRLKRK